MQEVSLLIIPHTTYIMARITGPCLRTIGIMEVRLAITLRVDANGYLGGWGVGNSLGVRPVINLKADTLFASGGTGTQSNPYVVK